MPQWIALLAIVVVGWLLLAVVGGMVIGRGLGAFERREPPVEPPAEGRDTERDDLRRAA